MSFCDFLDDVKNVGCCRSASLLLPARDAAGVLRKLRELSWVNAHVLIRPWASNRGKRSSIKERHSHAREKSTDSCLPSASDVDFVAKRFGLPKAMSTRDGLAQFHTESKSILVPLSEEATVVILREMFDLVTFCEVEAESESRMANDLQAGRFVQQMMNTNRVTLVHNCEGSQLVSLSKEEDVFPTSLCNNSVGPDQFTFIDLFAGIGGFRIALESLGGVCVGSCELDQHARDTYRLNFLCEEEFFVNDIARLDVPLHFADLLCGGFPCQSFSTMSNFDCGDEGRTRQGGLETKGKGQLFFQLLRVLRQSKPKVFIFENVKGLVKMQDGEHLDRILRLLMDSGYQVSYGVVDAAWFLPQRRERVFFTGVRLDLQTEDCSIPVDFAALKRKYKIYASNEIDHSKDKFDRVLVRHSAKTRPPNDHASSIGDCLETGLDDDSLPFLSAEQWDKVGNQSYVQLHADGSGRLVSEDDTCVQTIITSYRASYLIHSQFVVPRESIFLHQQNDQLIEEALKRKPHYAERLRLSCSSDKINLNATLPRFFTPRECLRFQGFPEAFKIPERQDLISQFYRQIGNAVSPPCVAAVAETILHHLAPNTKSTVFDLVLKASPNKAKVLARIHALHSDSPRAKSIQIVKSQS